eukprot:6199389-Pleurochrysis_carterae.AAC.1
MARRVRFSGAEYRRVTQLLPAGPEASFVLSVQRGAQRRREAFKLYRYLSAATPSPAACCPAGRVDFTPVRLRIPEASSSAVRTRSPRRLCRLLPLESVPNISKLLRPSAGGETPALVFDPTDLDVDPRDPAALLEALPFLPLAPRAGRHTHARLRKVTVESSFLAVSPSQRMARRTTTARATTARARRTTTTTTTPTRTVSSRKASTRSSPRWRSPQRGARTLRRRHVCVDLVVTASSLNTAEKAIHGLGVFKARQEGVC